MREPTSVLILCIVLVCAATHVAAITTTNVTTVDVNDIFVSPFYNDSEALLSAKSTALGAAIISGIFWNPINSAHVARISTILGLCKPYAAYEPLPLSQLPLVMKLGNHPTQYYAGAATMNPVAFIVLFLLGLLVGLIVSRAQRVSFSEALRKLRFPSVLAFPLVFLVQPSVMCAMTVFLYDDQPALIATSAIGTAFWFCLVIGVGVFLKIKVPQMARFVRNFRHQTVDAKAQRKLLDTCRQIERKRLEREEFRRKQKERQSTDLSHDDSATVRSGKSNLAGIMSSLAGVFALHRRAEEAEARRQEELRRQQEEDSDEELHSLVQKQAQFQYAKMLSMSLDETAVDEEGALKQLLVGADRWVDYAHNDEEEEADVDTVDIAGIHPSMGFVRRYGVFFAKYTRGFTGFIVVELLFSFACGLLEGWRPTSPKGSDCLPQAGCLAGLMALYFLSVLATHAYISSFEYVFNVLIAFAQFIASTFLVVSLIRHDNWANVTSYVIAVCCVYMLAVKSLVDAYSALIGYFVTKSTVWPGIKQLTREYLNMDSTEVGSPKLSAAREKALNKLKELVKNAQTQEKDPNEKEEGEMEDEELASLDPSEALMGRNFKRQTTLLQATRAISEALITSYGGRNNMFVCSRGVPESFHPFIQRPLAPKIPLPPRSREEIQRRLEKSAKERRKNYWGSTLLNTVVEQPAPTATQETDKGTSAPPQQPVVIEDYLLDSDSDDEFDLERHKQKVRLRHERKLGELFGSKHREGSPFGNRSRWEDVYEHFHRKIVEDDSKPERRRSSRAAKLTAEGLQELSGANGFKEKGPPRGEDEADEELIEMKIFPNHRSVLARQAVPVPPGILYRQSTTDLSRGQYVPPIPPMSQVGSPTSTLGRETNPSMNSFSSVPTGSTGTFDNPSFSLPIPSTTSSPDQKKEKLTATEVWSAMMSGRRRGREETNREHQQSPQRAIPKRRTKPGKLS